MHISSMLDLYFMIQSSLVLVANFDKTLTLMISANLCFGQSALNPVFEVQESLKVPDVFPHLLLKVFDSHR